MADKYQRKVNKQIKSFNKGFEKDISPYSMYRIRQVERYNPKNVWESAWLLQLTKGGEVISENWFDFYEIINPLREKYVGRKLFWWVNNEVVRTKND